MNILTPGIWEMQGMRSEQGHAAPGTARHQDGRQSFRHAVQATRPAREGCGHSRRNRPRCALLALEITENIAMHNGPEIVTTLNELKALGVIAEGVEKEEQAELLEACGCKEVQGYHFCMPVSEKELR